MIDLAATPGPAAMAAGKDGLGSASRDGAAGFADLVERSAAGKAHAGVSGGADAAPDAADDAATREPLREAAAPTDETAPADGEAAPARSMRRLHEVLASLLRETAGPADRGAEAPAAAVPGMTGDAGVAEKDARTLAEEPAPEREDEADGDADEVDPGPAAGPGAVVSAIILPVQPRERQPAGSGAAGPAAQTAAALPATPDAAPPEENAERDGQPSRDERRSEAADTAGRRGPPSETGELKVRVIAETVAPAPGPSPTGRTVADLAAALSSDAGWKAALEGAAAARLDAAGAPPGPVRDLRIQLNPAELGSVDARLRIVGEQLSVEIRVEGSEAFRRLSSEKEAILTALRGLGFAVDDVSIQQQPPASNPLQASGGGRQGDPSGGFSQGAGRGQNGDGGAAGGHPRGQERGGQNGDARAPATRPHGGGLYI